MTTVTPPTARPEYKPKWQKRFSFFDNYGAPSDPRHKQAVKELPDFKSKVLISANLIAFIFGPIYLFVLGLWKKNLALIGLMLAIQLVLAFVFALLGKDMPQAIGSGLNVAFSMMYALTTNYAYYLKEVKGEQSWNPFEGMRL